MSSVRIGNKPPNTIAMSNSGVRALVTRRQRLTRLDVQRRPVDGDRALPGLAHQQLERPSRVGVALTQQRPAGQIGVQREALLRGASDLDGRRAPDGGVDSSAAGVDSLHPDCRDLMRPH